MAVPFFAGSIGAVALKVMGVMFTVKLISFLGAIGVSVGVYFALEAFVALGIAHIKGYIDLGTVGYAGYIVDIAGLAGEAGVDRALNIVLSGYVGLATIKSGRLAFHAIKPV